MKKIEIYKDDELQLSTIVTDYDINIYSNSFEVVCKIEEIEITCCVPLNKGYKIIADV